MKNNTPKFRASFSVLSLWKSGRWEDAISQYFKLEGYTTRAMAEGKSYHEKWEKEIKKTGCLPSVFGGKKLEKPQTELKLVSQLDDWLEVVGVIDCYDNPVVHEFKTGVTTAQQYANSMQVGIYAALAVLNGMLVEKAEIHHFNQHNNKADMAIVWISDRVLKDAMEWITTLSSEMQNYLVENNLYERLGKNNEIQSKT